MNQMEGCLARTESLEMHTMSSSELTKRYQGPPVTIPHIHPSCLIGEIMWTVPGHDAVTDVARLHHVATVIVHSAMHSHWHGLVM